MNSSSSFRSRRGGIVRKLLIGLAALVVVLVLGWVLFLPSLVERKFTQISGFPLEIESLSANPFGLTAKVEKLAVKNPAEFPNPAFFDLSRFEMEVKPFSLMSERVEIPKLHLDIDKVTVVTNKDGVVNAQLFQKRMDEYAGTSESGDSGSDTTKAFHIDDLVIRIGRIELVDYSKGAEPVTNTIEIGIDQQFHDVSDFSVVVAPIMADLLRANAGRIGALLPPEYQNQLKGGSSLLDAASGLLGGDKKSKNVDAAKKLFESLQGDGKP